MDVVAVLCGPTWKIMCIVEKSPSCCFIFNVGSASDNREERDGLIGFKDSRGSFSDHTPTRVIKANAE